MTAQSHKEVVVLMNPNVGMPATRVRDFTRMDTLEFHCSKVDEYPQEIIDEEYKEFMVMRVMLVENTELVA